MSRFQIIGIMLVKNEDVFVEQAVRNVIHFCDRLIITDHQSLDHTFAICEHLAAEFSNIELHKIDHAVESAQIIAPYYNTNTWIFAVDGDEVYDPEGLKNMRKYLLNDMFLGVWCIFGNVLNVAELDLKGGKARGYLSPPSRSITKLYNFSIIEDWLDCTTERLHGGTIIFKPGFHSGMRHYLHEELNWETAYFRCLHVTFLARSSRDTVRLVETRLNPDELNRISDANGFLLRLITGIRLRFDQLLRRDWKNRKYRRGALVEKDIQPFFSSRAQT